MAIMSWWPRPRLQGRQAGWGRPLLFGVLYSSWLLVVCVSGWWVASWVWGWRVVGSWTWVCVLRTAETTIERVWECGVLIHGSNN